MLTSSPSRVFLTARLPRVVVVAITGVLVWFGSVSQPVQAQEVAAGQQDVAEEADAAARLVPGDDLRGVVPDLTKEIAMYLEKRRTRRVVIDGLDGARPLVEKVLVRTLTAGLKSEGIVNDLSATTRLKGKLVERQVGGRRLAVLEWCLQDQTGFELCSMRRRLTVTGPLVVEADDDVIESREE